jgi:murein L,D-transpeptidase YcbB/YkuD
VKGDKESLNLWKIVTDFYTSGNYRPAWVESTGLRPQANTFIGIIENSSRSGLNPADYDFLQIVELRETVSKKQSSGSTHDSPIGALFQRIERDFSHGCIRIERPFDLALYVLNDQDDWTAEKIDADLPEVLLR